MRTLPLPAPPPRHECTPSCSFFTQGDIFVCIASNNVHFCSARLCRCLQVDSDEEVQVCSITACCYPLDFVMSIDMELSSGSATSTSAAAPSRQLPVHAPSPRTRPDMSISKRMRDQSNPTIAVKQRLEVRHQLKQVLEPVITDSGVSLFHLIDKQRLIDTTCNLWRKCISTKQYQQQPYRYRHRYHILVVLYGCIKGLAIHKQKVELIPQCEAIHRYLPPFKTLPKRIKDLDISTYTKTTKIFLACMRELYPTQ